MDSEDIKEIRKLCIELSKYLKTSLEFFLKEPLDSLFEISKEVCDGEST